MRTNLKLKKAIKHRSEQDNLRIKALNQGVELIAPETIFLSKDTTFGKNVKIEPYVVIGSKVKIGNNVTIKSFSHLEGAKLEKNVTVGPYARIRPGSHFLPGSKVGNFVETKNSKIKSIYNISCRCTRSTPLSHGHISVDNDRCDEAIAWITSTR